ncbi:hypothetical protein [Arthrobacter sp. 08Y14]|uniref:hypothetical protein n=1 Tax=Arthrobacter sp. 08Y14 TaxID=2058885 RepID=UPI000CE47B80|nr:hypothetical protein [Arthrobacter sp. 08Y14]
MTVYATNLTQVLTTVRTSLAERVCPAVTDPAASLELRMIIEQIDNLIGRTAWDPAKVQNACELTDQLADRLRANPSTPGPASGVRKSDVPGADAPGANVPAADDPGSGDPVEDLVQRRRNVAQRLRTTYADGDAADLAATVAAVAEFSSTDIRDQISAGMRRALPF